MLNKIKSLSEILVSCYVLRLLVTGASIGDALVIIALSGIYVTNMYLESKKEPEANVELKNRLSDVEKLVQQASSKVSAMQIRR